MGRDASATRNIRRLGGSGGIGSEPDHRDRHRSDGGCGAQLFGAARVLPPDHPERDHYWAAFRWESQHAERGRPLLVALRPCFTAPSFATFAVLVAGMVAQPSRCTITGMWTGAGLAGVWHHAREHWFFARARWSADALGLAVTAVLVQRL